MTEYRHEAVEVCPHCMGENTVPDWAPKTAGAQPASIAVNEFSCVMNASTGKTIRERFAIGVMAAASVIWATTRWLNGSRLSGRV